MVKKNEKHSAIVERWKNLNDLWNDGKRIVKQQIYFTTLLFMKYFNKSLGFYWEKKLCMRWVLLEIQSI